jgi:hypothetical protein
MQANLNNKKQWWSPVWTGLVMDRQARHYKRMKNTIWLFLYLVINADKGGFLVRKVKTIGSDMGIKRDTILRWLNILRRHGYIATQSTGRGLLIQIRDWGNPSSDMGKSPLQKQRGADSYSWENPATEKAFKSPNSHNLSKRLDSSAEPIDTINKYILNNDIDSSNPRDLLLRTANQSKSTELAMDIATALGDHKNLALYISYSRRYPVSLLRRVLGEVKEIPSEKIKKSRGALFNYLVQKYAKKTS